jgi:hypothetical protein
MSDNSNNITGIITFKVKSGAQISINTINVVSIERRDNFIYILFNATKFRGICCWINGNLHRETYEYKSADDAEAAFKMMCGAFNYPMPC